MQVLLYDQDIREYLLPLTFTRPVSELKTGILSLREKWERRLEANYSFLTADYLSSLFPRSTEQDLVINAAVCATDRMLDAVMSLKEGQQLVKGEIVIAERISTTFTSWSQDAERVDFSGSFNYINRPWQLFLTADDELQKDFNLVTTGRSSAPISDTNTLIGNQIFLEEGAKAECAVFNTLDGPVYLAAGSEVMEGATIRGGLALGKNSQIKMGARIYGPTCIGPWSKVGGEVGNSIILGYSNKGHDGYLGNAVIGEWCNIGADSNNSNLKNNYDEIRMWSYVNQGFEKTGLQFCGLIMGDHSKCGINTMFNTGTIVGVMCNIYGSGFPRTFIPSYSWGGAGGYSIYKFEKAMDTAKRVMARRKMELTPELTKMLAEVFSLTSQWRVKA